MLLQISDVIGINIESHLLNKKVMASLLITAAALYGALLHSQGCDAEKINNMRNDQIESSRKHFWILVKQTRVVIVQ